MSRKIAAFDLDGTLLTKNSSFAFCRFLCRKGFFSYLDLTFCSLLYLGHKCSLVNLQRLHQKVFNRLFKGKSFFAFQPFLQEFLQEEVDKLWYQPALDELLGYQGRGVDCIVLSNSPRFIVEAIASRVGVNHVFATEYAFDREGILLNLSRLVDGDQKKNKIEQLGATVSIAYSDSHLDLPFLDSTQIAVAVNPTWQLKKIARKRGWKII